MTRAYCVACWACLFVLVAGNGHALRAQQPVVFIHGIQSSAAEWQIGADQLQSQFAITKEIPNLDDYETYQSQLLSIMGQNGPLAPLAPPKLLVGHSNGGVVARLAARERTLSGIITLGTPNGGAPVVVRWPGFANHVAYVINVLFVSRNAAVQIASTRPVGFPCCDWWWIANQVADAFSLVYIMDWGVSGLVTSLGLNTAAPVLGQMNPNSGFMLQDLNSGSSVANEMATVPTRIGIMSSASRYGGFMRALDPDFAEDWGDILTAGALIYYGTSTTISLSADPYDWEAQDLAYYLWVSGYLLETLDMVWCGTVSYTVINECTENDGVVPLWSQQLPGAFNLYTLYEAGPEHTREKQHSNTWLYDAFANYAHVPLGGTPPTPPGPGSGAVLTAGQALYPGQSITSPNGVFSLKYQVDGNLVLYQNGTQPVWAINCWPICNGPYTAGMTIMQTDGNFVVYDAGGAPVWHIGTNGNPGAYLVLGDDSSLAVYSDTGALLWER